MSDWLILCTRILARKSQPEVHIFYRFRYHPEFMQNDQCFWESSFVRKWVGAIREVELYWRAISWPREKYNVWSSQFSRLTNAGTWSTHNISTLVTEKLNIEQKAEYCKIIPFIFTDAIDCIGLFAGGWKWDANRAFVSPRLSYSSKCNWAQGQGTKCVLSIRWVIWLARMLLLSGVPSDLQNSLYWVSCTNVWMMMGCDAEVAILCKQKFL